MISNQTIRSSHRYREHRSSSMFFILFLFAVLVIIGELLICMGTSVYENILSSMNENDTYRTASAYILQKVRQSQDDESIRCDVIDGHDAIVLQQSLGGELYETWLYAEGGTLRELLTRADNDSVSASAGSPVVELRELQIDEDSRDDFLVVTLLFESGSQKLLIPLL